jgi:hypothetical protein
MLSQKERAPRSPKLKVLFLKNMGDCFLIYIILAIPFMPKYWRIAVDQTLASIIITALIIIPLSIVAIVAITYREMDIAALALKLMSHLSINKPPADSEHPKKNRNNNRLGR